MSWLADATNLLIAVLLVFLNGFFVAAEFALVKVRIGQVEQHVKEGKPLARMALWLLQRMDHSLSACQLGITIASLALGWIGEPALAELLRPLFEELSLPEAAIHGIVFALGFSTITALHLVVGEQAPKIFAIRRPEPLIYWCAPLMVCFYFLLYPFLPLLNHSTSWLLRRFGIDGGGDHASPPHTEDEIRALLREAHLHGSLTRSEHRLLNAVFEFDDMICRRVMLPRRDVDYFDVNQSLSECLELARRTQHTRYPVCDGSLDQLLGVVHIKDLIGIPPNSDIAITSMMRPPRKVPESMPISLLLRHFQATHQLLAFVIDEYGTVIGIVTLENVLEKIVGPVEDEFDAEQPAIVSAGPGQFVVLGSTPVEEVERALGLELAEEDAETISGILMTRTRKLPVVGQRIQFDGAVAEVQEVRDDRAIKILFTQAASPPPAEDAPPEPGSTAEPAH